MRKKHLFILCAAAVLLCFAFVSCSGQGGENSADKGCQLPYRLENGCDIVAFKGVTGVYPEDGADAEKENIAALVVENSTEDSFQLMNITVETDRGTLAFDLTTLFTGSKITVLEKNAAVFSSDMKIKSVTVTRSIAFSQPPTVYPDIFEISVHDSVLNVRNISGADIHEDIFIYYKTIDENGDWYGGITYRTRADRGLRNGELRQLPASHFRTESSKVVFVTYAE
ncbi:MAG: hypothetical protein PUC33_05840 [Oscillospiraceae bacterium]|nr:hypothetical protein [Oscillospiraceae bacterium]